MDIHDSVRGKNVYIVQSSGRDTNNHLMGLLLFVQVTPSPVTSPGSLCVNTQYRIDASIILYYCHLLKIQFSQPSWPGRGSEIVGRRLQTSLNNPLTDSAMTIPAITLLIQRWCELTFH